MPETDPFSMTLMVAVNLMTVAFALPWFMGQQMSRATRNAQQFLLLQGLAWLLVFCAGHVLPFTWNALLSISSAAAATGALWQLHKALKGWLGPRNKILTRSLALLCLLTLAGVLVLIESKPYRLAWFNISYGLSLVTLVCLTLSPQTNSAAAWRYLLLGAGLCIASILLIRGYFTLNAPWLRSFAEEPSPHMLLSWLIPIGSAIFFVSILMACRDEEVRQRSANAPEDSLTGLPLRQAIKNQARFMLNRARREGLPLALILIDMDHFSRVNSRHGYQAGDAALQLMSRTLRKQMRGDEVVARWQGESFCLLIHADQLGVRSLLTRIQSAFQIGAQYELQMDLDFSAGCALVPSAWKSLSLNELASHADTALQQAKNQGRGRVECTTLTPPPGEDHAPSDLAPLT